jgi:hypothetical protein
VELGSALSGSVRERLEILRSLNVRLACRGHAISGVKPHLLVVQEAKYFFKKRPQFLLVVFIGGEFAESHPLLLVCQIGQISNRTKQLYHR